MAYFKETHAKETEFKYRNGGFISTDPDSASISKKIYVEPSIINTAN